MEIRLAAKQGLLSKPSLNMYQQFALSYWLYMQRRTKIKDVNETLQKQVWYLDPDRFHDLFLAGTFQQKPFVAEPDTPVDDVDEIDRYFEQLDQKQSMNGAQLFSFLGADEQGWV